MKFLKYILFFTIIFTSCKAKKNMIDVTAKAKDISAKKLLKNIQRQILIGKR